MPAKRALLVGSPRTTPLFNAFMRHTLATPSLFRPKSPIPFTHLGAASLLLPTSSVLLMGHDRIHQENLLVPSEGGGEEVSPAPPFRKYSEPSRASSSAHRASRRGKPRGDATTPMQTRAPPAYSDTCMLGLLPLPGYL